MKRNVLLLTLISATLLPTTSYAQDLGFKLGTGWPYVATAELSTPLTEQSSLFVNYKVSADDGFAFGYEHALSNPKHSIGTYIGAVGVKSHECEDFQSSDDDIETEIGSAFSNTLGCALGSVFGNKSTKGVAAFYSYHSNALNQSGWSTRLELGYGENANRKDNVAHLNLAIQYQF